MIARMRHAFIVGLLLAATGITACAPQKPFVTTAGALPQQGGYELAGPAPAERLQSELTRRLAALDLGPSDEADYLLQIGSFQRPASVGSLIPDQGDPEWLRSPTLGSKRIVRGLMVSLTARDTGQEVYRVTTQLTEGKQARPDTLDRLIAAAFPLPAAQPAPAEPR